VPGGWIHDVVKSRRDDLSTLPADPLRVLIGELAAQINAAVASGEVSDEEAEEAAVWIGDTVRSRPDATTRQVSLSAHRTFTIPLPDDE
jgi:hypothetical protein